MKSITKIYEAGENNKSVAEAVVLSALDIAVASSLGVFADILAAIIDITGAMADTAPDKSLKVNYIPKKGDDCMNKYKCRKTEYTAINSYNNKEEEKCIKRIQSRKF